jgi:hypothetical protein
MKTLYDQIKEMSATELAEFLEQNNAKFIQNADRYICKRCKHSYDGHCPCTEGKCLYEFWSDADLIREWLMQEVEQ